METKDNAYPEEISLREIIEVILKGWKFIVIVVLIAVIISAVVSVFFISPVYEANVTLMASAATKLEMPQSRGGVSGFLDSLSATSAPTLDTYKTQVKSPVVLQNVLNDMGIGEDELTRHRLADKISTEIVENTNLLRIKVRDSDPDFATNIADNLAMNFIKYVSDLAKERALTSYRYLEGQMNVEKGLLEKAQAEYKEFLAQPRNVDELKAEISSRLNFITDYKVKYMQNEVEENAKKATLITLQKEFADTEKVLVTKKSLSEDAFLNNIISDSLGENPAKTGVVLMENQEINPNYLNLERLISTLNADLATLETERQNIRTQIVQNSAELERLQTELAEKQYEEEILKRNINLAKQTYDAFYSKYEEIRIAQSGRVGEANIVLAVPAMASTAPISPNKRLNVAIAGVLGLMVSVFIVFLKDYWERTEA